MSSTTGVRTTPTVPAVRRKRRQQPSKPFLGAAGILGFLLLWELLPAVEVLDANYLPPASKVLVALAHDLGLAAFWGTAPSPPQHVSSDAPTV